MQKIKGQFVSIKTGRVKLISPEATIKSLSGMQGSQNPFGFTQAFSAKNVCSQKQVIFALHHTLDSFEKGTNRLKLPALELLLCVTATDQLDNAIKVCGLQKGENDVVIVCCAGTKKELAKNISHVQKILGFKPKKIFPQKSPSIAKAFKITQAELAALSDKKFALEALVLEKMALAVLK